MNIAFMGSPKISKDILEYIYENGIDIKLVVTKEDNIRGRGKKKIPTPVKSFSESKNIPVLTPKKIDDEFISEFKKHNIDLCIVVAYGKILPKKFLEIPKYGCINVHFSALPKYRGASPVESAILNGEEKTGISIMYMNEKMDEGDIILLKEFPILENDKTEDVFKKAVEISNTALFDVIKDIKEETVQRKPQDHEKATYCGMFSKEDTILNFNESVSGIHNKVRAFSMHLGTKTDILGFNVKIWETRKILKDSEEYKNIQNNLEKKYNEDIINNILAESILIYEKALYIKAKDGLLKILVIQPENKGKMKIADFINGYMAKISNKNIKIL